MHITHVAIWVHDIEKLRRFYETYFGASAGAKYTNTAKRFESYFLALSSGARLELMSRPDIQERQGDEQTYGYAHLSIAVGSQEDVDRLISQLRIDNYMILDGPRWTGDGYYESVVADPEGNRVEITI